MQRNNDLEALFLLFFACFSGYSENRLKSTLFLPLKSTLFLPLKSTSKNHPIFTTKKHPIFTTKKLLKSTLNLGT